MERWATNPTVGFTVKVGDRIRLHPASDIWMRGVRYAKIMKIGRKFLTCRDDCGRMFRIIPRNVYDVIDSKPVY